MSMPLAKEAYGLIRAAWYEYGADQSLVDLEAAERQQNLTPRQATELVFLRLLDDAKTKLKVLLDSPTGRQPPVRGAGSLACPKCGCTDRWDYRETIGNSRNVRGLNKRGVLVIESFYTTDGLDDGDDGHLVCGQCGTDCDIPDGLAIEFV